MGRIFEKIKIDYVIIGICFLFFVTPALESTLTRGKPTAEDWNRHGVWIQQYIDGDFSPFWKYPPFWHFSLIPFVLLLGSQIQLSQVLFAGLGFLSIVWLSRKWEGENASILTALMVCSSIVLIQFAPALMPQSFDYIFMPLMAYFFFKKKYWLTTGILVYLGGTHLFGVFPLFIMGIYSLVRRREFLKYVVLATLLCLPFFLTSYASGFVGMTGEIAQIGDQTWRPFEHSYQAWSNNWDRQFTYPIYNFIAWSSIVTWLLLPFTIYSMYRVKKYDAYQLFYVCWFIGLVPLMFFNLWRWISYAIIPIILFTSSVISDYLKARENDNRA